MCFISFVWRRWTGAYWLSLLYQIFHMYSSHLPYPLFHFLGFQPPVVWKYWMGNSRNKQFIHFKLHAVLLRGMKSLVVPFCPAQDVNHPIAQHIHSVLGDLPISQKTSTIEDPQPLTALAPNIQPWSSSWPNDPRSPRIIQMTLLLAYSQKVHSSLTLCHSDCHSPHFISSLTLSQGRNGWARYGKIF